MKEMPQDLKLSLIKYLSDHHPNPEREVNFGRIDDVDEWTRINKPFCFVVAQVIERVQGNVYALYDTAYGGLYLFDGQVWHKDLQGYQVVTNDYVFLADYHGYSEGVIYKRVTELATAH